MKLGEGGEAFFVFETLDEIPASLQTSPIVSPATSPPGMAAQDIPTLQEPEFLDLATDGQASRTNEPALQTRPLISDNRRAQSDYGGSQQALSMLVVDWSRRRRIDSPIFFA